MFKNLCISKVLICGTHAHLHWEYCRSSRRRPAAADRGSPTRICSDTLACSARFCSPPRRWPREASSRRSLAVECCPFRSSCRVGGGCGRERSWVVRTALWVEMESAYRPRILLTHPFDTCRMREMSQGRAPEWASSTIFWRVESGSGRPPTNTPPNWLTPLWPLFR